MGARLMRTSGRALRATNRIRTAGLRAGAGGLGVTPNRGNENTSGS